MLKSYQFSMAVCSLSNLPDSKKILTDFSSIGHSSGTDTLCGIAYIFQNLHYLILYKLYMSF